MNGWIAVLPKHMDGRFLWLALGPRVTLGVFEAGRWCSLDGGFRKKETPSHCMEIPGVNDWMQAQRYLRKCPPPNAPEAGPPQPRIGDKP